MEMLSKIPMADLTNLDLKVDIGDEICFNLHNELEEKVIVINW